MGTLPQAVACEALTDSTQLGTWWGPNGFTVPNETLVTSSLADHGAETELRLAQGEFATEERYALHEAGWTETLERLDQFLRGGA